jgi:hypothetical protein
MNWPYLMRIAGIVLLVVIFGGLIIVSAIYQDQVRKTNYGFGPEWDCYYQQKVGPVCTKRVRKPDKSN